MAAAVMEDTMADGITIIMAGIRAGTLDLAGVMAAAGAGVLAGIAGTAVAGAGEAMLIIHHTMAVTTTITATTMAIADLDPTFREEETNTITTAGIIPDIATTERMLTAAEETMTQTLAAEASITTETILPVPEATLAAETTLA